MDIGAELRAAREAKGLTLGTLSHRTRVQSRTLAAIELNDLSAIPPRPFGRGFVRAYAQEVNLDPDRTVQNYFSQFPPVQQPPPPARSRTLADRAFEAPSPWTALGIAAAILLAVVAAAMLIGRRSDDSPAAPARAASSDARGAVGTTGSNEPVADRAASAAAVAPAAAASASAGQTAPMRLAFTVTRPCWVAASADGRRTIYRIVDSGEQLTVDAEREIVARFGDAGAVSWSINGRAGASLGEAGAVRNVHCSMPNAECRF